MNLQNRILPALSEDSKLLPRPRHFNQIQQALETHQDQFKSLQVQVPLGPGAIAGIAIGGLFVVALATSLCYFLGRSSSYRTMLRKRDEAVEQNAALPNATSVSSPQSENGTVASSHHSF
jgi:hypothetical protein